MYAYSLTLLHTANAYSVEREMSASSSTRSMPGLQNAYESASEPVPLLTNVKLCGPMPNVMAALPNIGSALCSTPQSLADAHYLSAVQ